MKKILFSALLAAVTLVACNKPADEPDKPGTGQVEKPDPEKPDPEKPKPQDPPYVGSIPNSIVPMDIAKDMGVGWNTTNTLDATGAGGLAAETSWGNPKVTKELIKAVADRGFKTLRVPVSWSTNIGDAPNYEINFDWMARVEEVVKWALEEDMYVILNMHHDDKYFQPTESGLASGKKYVATMWKQIATRFKRYNERLIFETLNEPREIGHPLEWQAGFVEGRKRINELHKSAVDAIRRTGGNNRYRLLMIAPWGASFNAMEGFELPNDKYLMVSLHSYSPYWFCLADFNPEYTLTDGHINGLKGEFDGYYNKFIAKGIPIVIGEWGAKTRNYPEGHALAPGNNEKDCIRHAAIFAKEAKLRGIVPVVWDFGYIDRRSYKWRRPEVIDGIIDAKDLWLEDK